MITEYNRRDIQPSWNINESDAQPVAQGVATAKTLSRCTDLNIVDIKETLAGACALGGASSCVASSAYAIDVFNGAFPYVYKWEIVTGTAHLEVDGSGQPRDYDATCVVVTTGDKTENFSLKVTVTDANGEQNARMMSFSHIRS